MRRWMGRIAGLALVVWMAVPAGAGWREFLDRVHLDWHRNNAWPLPFSDMDRCFTRQPFQVAIHNGWRMENTLGDELFHSETHALTPAGYHKIRWILTQAPKSRRTVYVLRGPNAKATAARLRSVRQVVANMHGAQGKDDAIVVIGIPPRRGSGAYLDRIRRSYEATTPAPRLPEADLNSSTED